MRKKKERRVRSNLKYDYTTVCHLAKTSIPRQTREVIKQYLAGELTKKELKKELREIRRNYFWWFDNKRWRYKAKQIGLLQEAIERHENMIARSVE